MTHKRHPETGEPIEHPVIELESGDTIRIPQAGRPGRKDETTPVKAPYGLQWSADLGQWIAEWGPPGMPPFDYGGTTSPAYMPYRDVMSADVQAEANRLLGRVPTPEELVAFERANIASQMSQAHQSLVSNAASRGLVHSGILRAQQQKLTEAGMGQLQAGVARAQEFPEKARAQILTALASGKPMPEVVYEVQPSGMIPTLLSAGGALVGGAYTGTPQGASAGYAIGRGVGTAIEGGPTYQTAGRPDSRFG